MRAHAVGHGERRRFAEPEPQPSSGRGGGAPGLHSAVLDAWQVHCHTPLSYVLADVHTTAALALQFKGQPRAIDGNRPELDKLLSKQARDVGGAAVVALRSASGVPQSPVEKMLATATTRTTVSLASANGSIQDFSIGILSPKVGDRSNR
jgi:hypothetical protein